jgi:hypothetical protein
MLGIKNEAPPANESTLEFTVTLVVTVLAAKAVVAACLAVTVAVPKPTTVKTSPAIETTLELLEVYVQAPLLEDVGGVKVMLLVHSSKGGIIKGPTDAVAVVTLTTVLTDAGS